ncbi:MAG: hypothetical protein Q8882_06645 [Bacillota bacterium]|nr:hypothetical protein [Bacillota bacterium]
MKIKNAKITKALAYAGTIIIWIPILFTLITSAVGSIGSKSFLMDYFIPAELFPVELFGALLLLWAAIRSRIYRKSFGGLMVTMLASLAGSQGIAVLTGLAKGTIKQAGWQFYLVMGLIALYIAAVIAQCILGIFMILKIREKEKKQV